MIKYVSGLFEKIAGKLNADTVLYVFLGLLVIVFVALVLLGGGEFSRIKRGESKLIKKLRGKNDGADMIKSDMEKMPDRIKKSYEKAGELNVFPATVMTVENCVLTPYSACILRSLCVVTLIVTAVLDALLLSYGSVVFEGKTAYVAVAVLTLAGTVLAVIGAVIARLSLKNAIKTHEKFLETLDSKAGVLKETAVPVAAGDNGFSPASVIDFDTVTAPETEEERAEEENKVVMTDFSEDDTEEESVEVFEPTVETEPVPELTAEETEEEDEPIVFNSGSPVDPEYEDVLTRVEKISRDGATVEEMKEVAALLERERMKPENRTPEGKRKLDEAFASLLRSVTRASQKRRR